MLNRLAINNNISICFAVNKSSSFNCNLVGKIGNFLRSMSRSRNRRILERRMFNYEWFVKLFVVQNERALCLFCRNNIACLKEFNIKR